MTVLDDGLTQTERRQLPVPVTDMPPLFDEPTTLKNWYKHINWVHVILLSSTPALGIYGIFTTKLQTATFAWSWIYYSLCCLGITAGYHRLWSHKSYTAKLPIKILLCLMGSGAVEGSIHWWSRGHRAHHRWTDSDKDPYAATRGFFFSHLGWMLVNRPNSRIGFADTADLKQDSIVQFQHKHYPYIALLMGFIFPTLVAGLGWGDFRGGFFFAAVTRLVLVHHATFCVNSLAHYIGDVPYDDFHTPKNSWITALVTMGEGYHNFHHQFPQDYRNAILFYQYDPTKWAIVALWFFGLVTDLKSFPANEIEKGRLQMIEKKTAEAKAKLSFGTPLEDLHVYTMSEYKDYVNKENKDWILLDGIVYDIENFDHPGGRKYLQASVGKDMTVSFNGGIYNHSNGARNLLSRMRVGVIKEQMHLLLANTSPSQAYDASLEPNKRE
ncbi:delta-9 desaturase [Phycomyces blakesleeanus]|uniref:Acyl-CoA desaturase n=2 Tax=Phycomyces blakesleeanus TaxID=4837 RepID=A0A162ZQI1_PHYB8|nr:hypothetical protein PHYBLDRAFT_156375 [Phycomyces blakesleeanus NRRL 1555(-)]OAD68401.1 hypothetical protein PHYBLDRAFT_156375 [Phycomyces blakesleeanus NRRL 1555(-)]|eukprot:XP_018286441.1 hypothetical protein PHYBLDRAFT_156375 [Phycomyces blakesleeanus NRRL 1555(-)]